MKTKDLNNRKCSISGKGMNSGFVLNDEYIKEQSDLIKVLRADYISAINADINANISKGYQGNDALGDALIPTTITDEDLLKYSYDNDYHYYTEWDDCDALEDDAEAYDDEGNLWDFDGSEWSRRIDLNDYDHVGGDGVEYEVWEHRENKSTLIIPIEIQRDFKNITFKE